MSYKLPRKYTPVVFAFYMSAMMALLMCFVIVAVNTGLDSTYLARVLQAYALAMPVAFVILQIVKPLVVKLVDASVSAT